MIRKVLVANRGEIALRIMRTCKRLGITTVAVYSDADRDAPHVQFGDEALRIGPAPASASYLSLPAVMEAARRSGADALHPGYGFLSEKPALPDACAAAGITFIGPPARAMRVLGDKVAARRVAEENDIPVLPGFASESLDGAGVIRWASDADLPLMIKAAAGGGGRGMRLVAAQEELPEALAAAGREAIAAFGDGRLFLERAVVGGRHIEVQVIADIHGNVVHLGERDCSIQRRYQKVVEESPAPAIAPELRERLCGAAVDMARAVGYVNVGTVEFLVEPYGAWYFLEMNARLQVEHGVTELVTGVDIVELQLGIAGGDPLPFAQDEVRVSGHAMECRVYAEDPVRANLPSSGRITYLRPPAGEGIRNDAGVETGTLVSTEYDPLLAKLLAHGSSRDEALSRCRRALAAYAVEGVTTNLGLLQAVVSDRSFRAGQADLRTLEGMEPEEFVSRPPDEALVAATVADLMAQAAANDDPWQRLGPWRSGGRRAMEYVYQGRSFPFEVDAVVGRTGAWRARLHESMHEFETTTAGPEGVAFVLDGCSSSWSIVREGRHLILGKDGAEYVLTRPPGLTGGAFRAVVTGAAGTLRAPMSGVVVRVLAEEGARVTRRQPIVVLEAMKMEHIIEASLDGVLKRVLCRPGDRVTDGDVLAELEGEEE